MEDIRIDFTLNTSSGKQQAVCAVTCELLKLVHKARKDLLSFERQKHIK